MRTSLTTDTQFSRSMSSLLAKLITFEVNFKLAIEKVWKFEY